MMQNHYIVITQTLEHVDHLVCRLTRAHLNPRPIVILCPLYDWNCRNDEVRGDGPDACHARLVLLCSLPPRSSHYRLTRHGCDYCAGRLAQARALQ